MNNFFENLDKALNTSFVMISSRNKKKEERNRRMENNGK